MAAIFFVVSAIFAAGAMVGFPAGAAIAGAAIAGAAAVFAVLAGGCCADAVPAITSVAEATTRRIRFKQNFGGRVIKCAEQGRR